jgi:ribosome modulation factor
VAADTIADDPRPYRVYLAWFGPGLVKVGITAYERGPARLLEQGAVCFSWLGHGPLMAARRSEELLRAALGVPDRIPYAHKRAVRAGLPGSREERAAEIAELHARAVALGGWPESLTPAPFAGVDHLAVFGLTGGADGGSAPVGEVTELVAGGAVGGELEAVAGPDLHLATERGVVVLDTRLMTGWELVAAGGEPCAVPVRAFQGVAGVQDGLF